MEKSIRRNNYSNGVRAVNCVGRHAVSDYTSLGLPAKHSWKGHDQSWAVVIILGLFIYFFKKILIWEVQERNLHIECRASNQRRIKKKPASPPKRKKLANAEISAGSWRGRLQASHHAALRAVTIKGCNTHTHAHLETQKNVDRTNVFWKLYFHTLSLFGKTCPKCQKNAISISFLSFSPSLTLDRTKGVMTITRAGHFRYFLIFSIIIFFSPFFIKLTTYFCTSPI